MFSVVPVMFAELLLVLIFGFALSSLVPREVLMARIEALQKGTPM